MLAWIADVNDDDVVDKLREMGFKCPCNVLYCEIEEVQMTSMCCLRPGGIVATVLFNFH